MISLKEECQLHIYFFYSVIILRLSKPKTLVHVRNKIFLMKAERFLSIESQFQTRS